jgi:penicillin-binding protein 1B
MEEHLLAEFEESQTDPSAAEDRSTQDTSTSESEQSSPQQPKPRKLKLNLKAIAKWMLLSTEILVLIGFVVFGVAYVRLGKWVDKQLAAGLFQHSYNYYAAPETVTVGDRESAAEVEGALRRCGLRDGTAKEPQTFDAGQNMLIVRTSTPVRIEFSGNEVRSITDLATNRPLDRFELPPQLITNCSEDGRAKRIMIHYADLPPVLVQAIVSVEDKRFFKHGGLDFLRIAKALYVDLKDRRKEQGASTITMQLARNLWLDHDKRWKRKIAESLITLHLERKLTKKQIMEYYCNLVYLGGRGTFSINGFGEAARAYFNKDIRKLNLTEAAMLAGLIQRPSYYNPFRYPDRALERRNIVLALMRENRYITGEQYQQAVRVPLGMHLGTTEMSGTQYFLDIAGDQLQRRLSERQNSFVNVYTTIDLRLQRAAEQAVQDGMALVEKQLSGRRKRNQPDGPTPQVALIVIDPHTGDVKAVVGGRDYSASQLNRVLSKRPPGSVFKPFVYTAAINSAIEGGPQVFTPASTILDGATTFQNGNKTYSPSNYKGAFMGQVTLRQALAHSLNNATVKLAEQVGFDKVVALAHRAGMNEDIKATPSVALGAYDVTPLEIASAYTIFANAGVRVTPNFIGAVRNRDGDRVYDYDPQTYRVLDPRVAFIMTDMLQEVLRSGTGAGVRARGFKLDAAGKTGTSHDGWFAGYTSKLLCVVWVGFDDYRDLGLEGARSALPIWTQFMMSATRYKEYRDAKPFSPAVGVVRLAVDPTTGYLAGPYCTARGESYYFVEGTQPATTCPEPEPPNVSVPTTAETVPAVERRP